MLHLYVLKVDRVLHMGTRVGSGRGHERSLAQSGVTTGDVRGHADGDVLARASAVSGRRSTVWASVRTFGYRHFALKISSGWYATILLLKLD
jgi:hypothetical protein